MDLKERYNKQDNDQEIEYDFQELSIGQCDEYSKVESILLHIPRRREVLGRTPGEVMYKSIPNYEKLLHEIDAYRKLLTSLGIDVYDDAQFKDADIHGPYPNLIYQRDLGVVTPDRLILANPKYDIRKGEQDIMFATLRRNGYIGPYMELPEDVTMEGADFFWVNENEVIISVGNRTDPEFAELFGKMYPNINIRTVHAAAEGIPQHILGGAHIVGPDTIIQRKSIIKHDLGFKNVIELEENEETINQYSMNIVTINNMEIIMPSGNPNTKKIYEDAGLIVHETPTFEIGKMGGSIACCSLILKRK